MKTNSIAQRISIARQIAGLTQKDMAKALNVSPRTYERWEEDTYKGYMDRLDAIAELVGVPVEELKEDAVVLLKEILNEVRAQSSKIDELSKGLKVGEGV